ncbi:MAG: hypothetical protein KH037_04740, partial [Burkholderiales bacterium]|nr:hypothetical protein [Burkholderiales bacterium]
SALWRFVSEAPTTEPYGGCCERGTGQPNPLLDLSRFLLVKKTKENQNKVYGKIYGMDFGPKS